MSCRDSTYGSGVRSSGLSIRRRQRHQAKRQPSQEERIEEEASKHAFGCCRGGAVACYAIRNVPIRPKSIEIDDGR